MDFLISLLTILETKMTQPKDWGWFHITTIILSVGFGILLCLTHKKGDDKRVRRTVFIVALIVFVLEIYKQFVYTFSVENGAIAADYQWYVFPWQFCSTPMYVGLLTAVFRKGRVHNALCAYLATYAVFASSCVMAYPEDIYIDLMGINIQTSVCHGSMITVGIYLWYSGYVKFEKKTMLGAMSVFASMVGVAVLLNEIMFRTGIIGDETFNMFFVSPHFPPSLPVYSLVQGKIPYPADLIIYIAVFSLAAFVMMALAQGIKLIALAIKSHGKKPCVR